MIATISLLIRCSTISTASIVAASVTRIPRTKLDFSPSLPISSVICGPPPCTTTGLMPTGSSSTTSWAKLSLSSVALHRVAAVFDYEGLAAKALDIGQRLDQHLGSIVDRIFAPRALPLQQTTASPGRAALSIGLGPRLAGRIPAQGSTGCYRM